LQSGGQRCNQIWFLVLKDRSKVNHNVIIFDARDDGNSSAATKAPFQIGGRVAFAANVKDGTAKALLLEWSLRPPAIHPRPIRFLSPQMASAAKALSRSYRHAKQAPRQWHEAYEAQESRRWRCGYHFRRRGLSIYGNLKTYWCCQVREFPSPCRTAATAGRSSRHHRRFATPYVASHHAAVMLATDLQ